MALELTSETIKMDFSSSRANPSRALWLLSFGLSDDLNYMVAHAHTAFQGWLA